MKNYINKTFKILPMSVAVFSMMVNVSSVAQLVSVDEQTLSDTDGQSGILIDAEMQFNRSQNSDGTIGDTVTCAKTGTDCEIAMRSDGDSSWLVLYNVSGGVKITNLKLDASTTTDGTPAVEIGDTSGNTKTKIEFDDFGTSSIAFVQNKNGTEGYRVPTTTTMGSGLDEGKPKGIVDLRINGTLEMTGGIKIFNCSGAVTGC